MLVIPLPTYLIDFLIGLNIVLSILVFLASFYIDKILQFSTFPSVLLITTLFRLALSVSTSRLILSDADAGDIIDTFGRFVIADNIIVGFVIFLIVTIVQFMVITKGAERVAEVAARFSLDGMPGKQMSIDADLRNGAIDSDEAKERRSIVERESQLYGSFDGAMKFIKGDAIAGIIIIFINFIGGISIGVSQHGMSMSQSLSIYTMLTIGDGLVAQIPALLIAIGAGFIVTRVSGDGLNIGNTIVVQLFGKSTILIIGAVIAFGIGTLPGFPFIIFTILSFSLCLMYFYKVNKAKRENKKQDVSSSLDDEYNNEQSSLSLVSNINEIASEAIPILLIINESHIDTFKNSELTERYRSQFYIDYGIYLPEISIRYSSNVELNSVTVLINEIKVGQFNTLFEHYVVEKSSEELNLLGIHYQTIDHKLWITETEMNSVVKLGYQVRHCIDEIYYLLSTVFIRHINEYFGVQATKNMLDKLEGKYPDLMKEVLRHATIQRISEVLQRLLSEKISVRNMKLIMEGLALWAPREKDVILLVEHIRGILARYICNKFSTNNILHTILLSSEFEEKIRQGIRNTSSGTFLNLEATVSEELMDNFSLAVNSIDASHKDLVVLSSVDIRRFLKRLIESRFKNIEVISYGEITDSVSIDIIKTV